MTQARSPQIPRNRPAFGLSHRSAADVVADAERQKRAVKQMTCRLHGLPWTECATCSPAQKTPRHG